MDIGTPLSFSSASEWCVLVKGDVGEKEEATMSKKINTKEQTNQCARGEVRRKIQDFLEGHTVVIWGSGATMPLGFPSMGDLLDKFVHVSEFREIQDIIGYGFEEKLSKLIAKKGSSEREVYEDQACKIIGELFNKTETTNRDGILCGSAKVKEYYQAMLALHAFLSAQPGIASPKSVDILTTNYDCSWELLFKRNGIPYLDGFSEEQKGFDYSAFFPKGDELLTRVVKIHGSDNWFRYGTTAPFVEKVAIGERPSQDSENMVPKIIIPSNLKYEEVSTDITFSNLMLTFGRLIKEAKSYLTIGFGFNDQHLTPLLKQEAMKGKPVVRLMKDTNRATAGRVFAEGIPNIITLSDAGDSERGKVRMTSVTWHKEGATGVFDIFDDDLWALPSFMKLLNEKPDLINH